MLLIKLIITIMIIIIIDWITKFELLYRNYFYDPCTILGPVRTCRKPAQRSRSIFE